MVLKTTVGELLDIIDSVWETTDVKLSTVSSNILLKGIAKANESWLLLYSTDYDCQCLGKLVVDLDESFVYVVSPDALVKGIRNLNKETEVKITIGKVNKVQAGSISYKFSVSDNILAHETAMKALPNLKETVSKANPLHLLAGFKAVTFAISKNPAIYGVTRTMEITGSDKVVKFSASDGSVAAVCKVTSLDVKEFSINLSREHITVFSRLLTQNPAGSVELHTEGTGPLFFKFYNLLFGCGRTIGKLPDIEKLITSFEVKCSSKIDVKTLKECLRRAALFTSKESFNHGIKLNCDKTKLTISTTEFEETLVSKFSEEASCIVRKDYLIECISSCKGDEIEIIFPENGKALIIKESFKDEDLTFSSSYVLMGMN